MYESIRIQNFRGLKDLTIENLGRVNLLVGANNVGKTSVLEALALLRARQEGTEIQQMLTSRGYLPGDSLTDVWAELVFRGAKGFSVTGKWPGTRHGVVGFTSYEAAGAVLAFHPITHYLVQATENGEMAFNSPSLILVHVDPASAEATAARGLNELPQRPIRLALLDPHALPPAWGRDAIFGPLVWVPFGYSYGAAGLADGLTRIQGTARYEVLLDALRSFDDRIVGLYPGYDSIAKKPLIRVGFTDLDQNLGLPALGDGVKRMFELLMTSPLAAGGVVLIDEIESGIYYQNLSALWRALSELSERDEVQIFSTSHSLECVEAAVRAFDGAHAGDFRLHRMSRRGDEIVATTYDHEAAVATLAVGVEFR